MRFSEQWLKTWIDSGQGLNELKETLTMAGLEVDLIEPVALPFNHIVTAEITDIKPHPTLQKLSICQIETHDSQFQVVCGASRLKMGWIVAYAPVGATLPNVDQIAAKKFDGIDSAGMLCSWNDLGIDQTGEGIIKFEGHVQLGTEIWQLLSLNDYSVEIDLTPNRGDCLSIRGIARELSALLNIPIHSIEIKPPLIQIQDEAVINVIEKEGCPNYAGCIVKEVDAARPTPLWIKERLRRSGIRSTSIIVDLLNYVMIELGQPLHAFDYDKLQGDIAVRYSTDKEHITLLDEQTIQLKPDTLVIADENGPIAIAGVMGSFESGVTYSTQTLFLESALFLPEIIAGKARQYGLVTDASIRFERGVDPLLQITALNRAIELITQYAGGQVGPITHQSSTQFKSDRDCHLRYEQISRVLGIQFEQSEIESYLDRLGAQYKRNQLGWDINSPSYRYDLNEEIDYIEEFGRLYGYNRIPTATPIASLKTQIEFSEKQISNQRIKRLLVDSGYYEVITYSFINPKTQSHFMFNGQALALKNPISQDMSVMRTSLWPGLITSVQHNFQRQQNRGKFFETGLIFKTTQSSLEQIPMVSGIVYGNVKPQNWASKDRPVDFYDIKGDVEKLISLNQASFDFRPYNIEGLHPGKSCGIFKQGELIGSIGAIHPELIEKLNLPKHIFVFEIRQDAIQCSALPIFEKISKYPFIKRDLALIVDQDLEADALIESIRSHMSGMLQSVTLFDVYQGPGIPPDKKSLAITLILQEKSRTLIDEEVEKLTESMLNLLKNQFNAELRE